MISLDTNMIIRNALENVNAVRRYLKEQQEACDNNAGETRAFASDIATMRENLDKARKSLLYAVGNKEAKP